MRNERIGRSGCMAGVTVISGLLMLGCQNTPRPTHAIRDSGDWQFERENYAAAAGEYQEIVDRTPGDWQAQFRLGQSLLELDRPKDARSALEAANSLKPDDEEILAELARAMHEQGAANELFAFLREQADKTRQTRDYMQIARYAILEHDYDMAEVALRTAIEVDGGQSVEPHLGMAALQKQLGRGAAAAEHLRRAREIDPADERVTQRLAEYESRTTSVTDD